MAPAEKQRVRHVLEKLVCVILVCIVYWNILSFGKVVADLHKDPDGVVKTENRYLGIRGALIRMKYPRGPIQFVTTRDLQVKPTSADDDREWSQGQYAMFPWILFRNGRAVSGHTVSADPPLVIADFWDGPPTGVPEGWTTIFDSGTGVILYRKKSGL